jgi:hypothetical protein
MILYDHFTIEYRIGPISYDTEDGLDEAWKVMKLFKDSPRTAADEVTGLRIAPNAPGKYVISSNVHATQTPAELLAGMDELLKPHGWRTF